MSDVAIRVENLGKKFLIGHKVEGDLRGSLSNKFRRLIGQSNGQAKEEFWALKDVSFEIKKGEAVGIIGRNGAGKSTLLKILSRITDPSTGRFEINGRVSSLLEVGTGFHSELTGRENIFLNGTILGMRRSEIKKKFDAIVDFSGVEKFIDTPVKHYSSGMKVRLAFSVAAHLEPEILIIDEVLAVGDAEFQKKCLGKMDEVSKNEGRTVLFVSHNLAAVSQICERCVLLRHGHLITIGEVDHVVHEYISFNKSRVDKNGLNNIELRKGSGEFRVTQIKMLNDKADPISILRTGSTVFFELIFNRKIKYDKGAFRIDFAIDNQQDMRIGWFSTDTVKLDFTEEFKTIKLRIPKFQFGAGTYYLTYFATWHGEVADYIHQAYPFEVEEGDFYGTGKTIPKTQTFFYLNYSFLLE